MPTQLVNPAALIERMSQDPRALTPRDILQLQGAVGNQNVGKMLVQPYRDFGHANGTPQYDYKIVNGVDPTYGTYHIKFHNFQNLDVFNEIHIVFERFNRGGYFFYTDQGNIIPDKSSGLKRNDAGLTQLAQQLINAQLATSAVVPNQIVEDLQKQKQEQEQKDKLKKEAWLAEAAEKAAKQKESAIDASVAAAVKEDATAVKLNDKGLLRSILAEQTFPMFKRFTVNDPIGKWPAALQSLSGPILEVVKGIELDTRVSNARDLDGRQRGFLIQIILGSKDKGDIHLPGDIFNLGENPVLSPNKKGTRYDIFYDAQEN